MHRMSYTRPCQLISTYGLIFLVSYLNHCSNTRNPRCTPVHTLRRILVRLSAFKFCIGRMSSFFASIGSSYPNATGNNLAHNMQIEQTADMIIIALAHAQTTGDGSLLQRHVCNPTLPSDCFAFLRGLRAVWSLQTVGGLPRHQFIGAGFCRVSHFSLDFLLNTDLRVLGLHPPRMASALRIRRIWHWKV